MRPIYQPVATTGGRDGSRTPSPAARRNMAHSHAGLNGDPCVVCHPRWQDFAKPQPTYRDLAAMALVIAIVLVAVVFGR